MSGEPVNAALAGLARAAADDDAAEQAALFAEFDGGNMAMFPAPAKRAEAGPGRPAGSQNRKTLALTRYYRGMGFRDPIAAQAEFITADPTAVRQWFVDNRLAGEAVPSLFEIVALQLKVADQVAPYIHGKQPLKVELDDRRLPVLIIDLGSDQLTTRVGRYLAGGEGELSAGKPLTIEGEAEDPAAEGQSEQDQGLSEGEMVKSHGPDVSRKD